MGRWRALTWLCLAELLIPSLWFSASAVLPALGQEWNLGDGGKAGLTTVAEPWSPRSNADLLSRARQRAEQVEGVGRRFDRKTGGQR